MNEDERTAALRRSPLFASLPSDFIDSIASQARLRRVPARTEVFHKGDPSTEFYALAQGELQVTTPSTDGRQLVIRTLRPVEVFGEIAVFDGEPRTASVVATLPSEVIVVGARHLFESIHREPGVALQLLAMFASKLRDTTEHLEDNVFLTIEARLAKQLLSMPTEKGGSEGSFRIGVPSQRILANMLGTGREAVNRQLAAWEKNGIVTRGDRFVEILDVDYLSGLAPGSED